MSSFGQRFTKAVGAGILPDNGIVDWFAALFIPHQSRFALIGNADGGNVGGGGAGLGQGGADDLAGPFPDLFRVVFYPPTLGKDLLMFALIIGHNRAGFVKQDKARTGCSGINGPDIVCHRSTCFSGYGLVVMRDT